MGGPPQAPPGPDTVVLQVPGPLGPVSQSSALLHSLFQHLLCISTYFLL